MLKLVDICKQYRTGDLIQNALRNVSFSLRDNEFVAILGHSGSGKTTLLNVIGGLDRYDSGDLIINGVSTKQYTDRDWDSYRNHTVGFVFQSYNLIPHQTVLANVELALTISGISPIERRKRAKEALRKVGLEDQGHKKPNQMSGGQMQRVAIARALVNDPDILLADEPTGALDSDTSIQVMDLLKEVAKDRLVVMVTHNPELAEQYATRTIVLHDGAIMSDSDPYEEAEETPAEHRNMGKSSMSILTALSLSFNNLWTKKARTLLTSFAGSIGIIGIALILSLSNGVNTYINDIQRDTMSSYPITVSEMSIDLSSMQNNRTIMMSGENGGDRAGDKAVYADSRLLEMEQNAENIAVTNNLKLFREYLVDENSPIRQYIGQNGIIYTYNVKFRVFSRDDSGKLLDTDDSADEPEEDEETENMAEMREAMMNNMMSMFGGASGAGTASNFSALTPGGGGELVSEVTKESYELLDGHWPESYDEIMLVLNRSYGIDATVMRQLGLISSEQYAKIKEDVENGKKVELSVDFDKVLGREFYLVPACDLFEKDGESGKFREKDDEQEDREQLADNGIVIKVSGIIMPKDNSENATIYTAAAYTNALTDYIIEYTNKSEVVLAQEAEPDINILTGLEFDTDSDEQRIEDVKVYIAGLSQAEKASLYAMLLYTHPDEMMSGIGGGFSMPSINFSSMIPQGTQDALSALTDDDEKKQAAAFDDWLKKNADDETLAQLYDLYSGINGTSSEAQLRANLADMGYGSGGRSFDVYTEGMSKISAGSRFVSSAAAGSATVLAGGAENVTDVLLVTGADGRMDARTLYRLGVITEEQYNRYSSGELPAQPDGDASGDAAPAQPEGDALTDYAAVVGKNITLYLAAPSDYYKAGENGFEKLADGDPALKTSATRLRVSGVVSTQNALLSNTFIYPEGLETLVDGKINNSAAVTAQLANPEIDVLTGKPFSGTMTDEQKAQAATALIGGMSDSEKANMYKLTAVGQLAGSLAENGDGAGNIDLGALLGQGMGSINLSSYMSSLMGSMGSLGGGDAESQAKALDKWLEGDPDEEVLLSIYDQYLSDKSYEDNLDKFGKVDYASPSSISIYADSFEDKESITRCISDYNETVGEDDRITYTDFVGLLMKSVTTIINVISYVLIAFVAVSLVVSSIMIGIITYISVLERTKEIGILRAIGASKRNISQVFNAETFIIGLCAGLIGIGVTALLIIPINAVIHALADIDNVNAILPPAGAAILVVLSVVLTYIGGLIPSKKAATKDPVTALRTD